MNKKEFNDFLDRIFQEIKDVSSINSGILSLYTEEEIKKINNYIEENYQNNITIEVYDYKIYGDDIILKTELGSFLLTNYYKTKHETIKKNIGKKYNLLQFFEIISKRNLESEIKNYNKEVTIYKNEQNKVYVNDDIILFDYLRKYYIYKMIINPEYGKRLFYTISNYFIYNDIIENIPLEYLNNPEFNYYIYTDANRYLANKLNYIYNNHYKFDNNLYLLFSMILVTEDYRKVDIIKNNLEVFKKFIIEEGCSKAFSNKYATFTLEYLKTTKLIEEFNEKEKILLYKNNPICYSKVFPDSYLEIARKISNNSPLIRLNNKEDIMVHIQYRDYDLYENKPIDMIKKATAKTEVSFLVRFLYSNKSIVKFYKTYYKSYLKAIKNNPEKNNLEDFIKSLLFPNNLVKIFESNKFNWDDINNLVKFKKYYGDEISNFIEQANTLCRKKSLLFYNEIVNTNNKKNNIDECLNKYNLNKDNIYEYIINNKFLYAREKNGLLNIINRYYGGTKVSDILFLLDEMLTRELTIDEILKEKNILKSDFQNMYKSSKEDNPILYNCIFDALNKNSRKGYIKLIRFGYIVLKEELKSLEEYNLKFGERISFEDLITGLKNTSLYDSLLEKSSTWIDFDKEDIKKKTRKKDNEE